MPPVPIRSFLAVVPQASADPIDLVIVLRRPTDEPPMRARPGGSWLLGDDSESYLGPKDICRANAVAIRIDAANSLNICTSITGLPPVFVHAGPNATLLSSGIDLIAGSPHAQLELDPEGVVDLARIGYPTALRTLYRNTSRLPPGARVSCGPGRPLQIDTAWTLPDAEPVPWDQFVDEQIVAFTAAVRDLDTSSSVLSLTAGLDTRAILAVLTASQRALAAATMTGPRQSLDARRAAALCRAYGMPHIPVVMDDSFTSDLPRYVERASRLSGGLASLRQAPEVYFYDQLGGRFAARLSGNAGNHVGRGGTEGLGMRGASLNVLTRGFRAEVRTERGHWLATPSRNSDPTFALQHEYPAALAGNYAVGNHFAIQQTPYADRALIETLAMRPSRPAANGSIAARRVRDLRHRLFGEPRAESFQRTLLTRLGGAAAALPINFGWLPPGDVSLRGLAWGSAALAGMAAQKWRLDQTAAGPLIDRLGLIELHDFHRSARWLRRHLSTFARDTLGAGSVGNCGVFDRGVLHRALAEHFSGKRDHHETIVFALDVALAHRFFCARPVAGRLRGAVCRAS